MLHFTHSIGRAKSLRSRGRSKTQHRLLRCEPLEDRRMLSASAGGESAIELFGSSTALFVENARQWADEEVRYGFNGDGVNIAFTDEGLAFLLSRQEVGSAAAVVGESVRFQHPGC